MAVAACVFAASLITVPLLIAQQRDYLPVRREFAGMALLGRSFRDALWALSIPVFIIGIRYGIFIPTEAGAITVLYVILAGMFACKSQKLSDLPRVMKETALDTAL